MIPDNKLCDSGCGQAAQFFSKDTGRYRCSKSANSCPANREKNKTGLRKAYSEGRKQLIFTDEMRNKSQTSHRKKLVSEKPFANLGHNLRKKIVIEDQGYKCLHCELTEWMGLRITLELDHIDGNRENNDRGNLRALCPNCHSITDTWKQGQTGKRKCSDEEIIEAYISSDSIGLTLKKLKMNWGSVQTVRKVLFRHKMIDKI